MTEGAPWFVICVSLFCNMLLTVRLYNCEPFRGHCSFDLNILNMHPKDLSFRIDKIFPSFISFITPKHNRSRLIPTRMAQIPSLMHADKLIPRQGK